MGAVGIVLLLQSGTLWHSAAAQGSVCTDMEPEQTGAPRHDLSVCACGCMRGESVSTHLTGISAFKQMGSLTMTCR